MTLYVRVRCGKHRGAIGRLVPNTLKNAEHDLRFDYKIEFPNGVVNYYNSPLSFFVFRKPKDQVIAGKMFKFAQRENFP